MHREFLMGNEAIALGALSAGVQLVSLQWDLQKRNGIQNSIDPIGTPNNRSLYLKRQQ